MTAAVAASALVAVPAFSQAGPGRSAAPDGDGTRAEQSTVEAYAGFKRIKWEEDEAEFDREERARENMTAACMRSRGRTYVAVFSQRFTQSETPPEQSRAPQNPNDQHVGAMTRSEREAYFMDLYGAPDPYDESNGATTSTSCVGRAHADVPGLYVVSRGLLEQRRQLFDLAPTTPSGRTATQAWARCMRDADYDYSTPASLFDTFDKVKKRPGAPEHSRAQGAVRRHEQACGPKLDESLHLIMNTLEDDFVQQHRGELEAHRAKMAKYKPLVDAYQE